MVRVVRKEGAFGRGGGGYDMNIYNASNSRTRHQNNDRQQGVTFKIRNKFALLLFSRYGNAPTASAFCLRPAPSLGWAEEAREDLQRSSGSHTGIEPRAG